MKTALITGVSSGIGRGIAGVLAKAGWRIYGSVRKTADADAFEDALGGKGTALLFDVTDRPAVDAAAARVAQETGADGLDLLVNNAGISVNGPLQFIEIDGLRRQIEVNTIALMSVTQAFLPLLGGALPKRANPGRIINMSSVGGKVANPFLGPYNASKFAVEGLSDALRRELMIYGIDVIVIEPGAIKTAIWEKIDQDDLGRFAHTAYAKPIESMLAYVGQIEKAGLPPEAVGRLVQKIMRAKRPRTRYVIQRGGPLGHYLMRWMPDRMLDRAIANRLGLGG